MKYPVVVVGALCLGLWACASPNEGNPDGAAYAGSSASVYDGSANPARTNGTVSYDPNAPLPAAAPAAGTSGSAMAPAMPATTARPAR